MTTEARVVLEAISLKMQKSGRAYVTVSETARQANISNTRARGQLKVLQARGLVLKSKVGHRNCFHIINCEIVQVALCHKTKIVKVALKKIKPAFCRTRLALTVVLD